LIREKQTQQLSEDLRAEFVGSDLFLSFAVLEDNLFVSYLESTAQFFFLSISACPCLARGENDV
jgi:hypothetical protein